MYFGNKPFQGITGPSPLNLLCSRDQLPGSFRHPAVTGTRVDRLGFLVFSASPTLPNVASKDSTGSWFMARGGIHAEA